MKTRVQTLKHVIFLIFSIVITFLTSLHFSERAFAAEAGDPLPADAVEEGEEDTQQKEDIPEPGSDGQAEISEESEADAGQTDSAEAEEETAADAEQADNEAAEEETEADVEQEDSTAEEETAADAGQEDSTAEEETAADAEQEDSTAEEETAADTEQADNADAEEETEADAEQTDSTAAEEETAPGTEQADIVLAEAEKETIGNVNGGSKTESSPVRSGGTLDPLIYLSECLGYHGNEEDPSAFSLRAYTEDGQSIVTPVKDQSPWQTCWGFSAIAASESSILSECYAKWDQLAPGLKEKYGIETFGQLCEWLDLSERQLAWFAFVPEPKDGNYPAQAGEGLYAREKGTGAVFNALGGNYFATSVFARGTGPLEESRVPYRNKEEISEIVANIIAKDGTEYSDKDYLGVKTITEQVEYECLIPKEMTKEEVIDFFNNDPDRQEMVRQRLEEGVKYGVQTTRVYEDDNGKLYFAVRFNELEGIMPGYPYIIAFRDEDGKRYEFDPVKMTIPGLPELHTAYYDWSVDETLHYASIVELESSDILPDYTTKDGINEDTIKAIKEELLAGRAVSIAFCADTASPGQTAAAKYINPANNVWAHYTYSNDAAANHGVTIIGYNDNFSKTLFLEGHEPPKDGAWLVKNSWGGGKSQGADFGNWGIDENNDGIGDGYFWISYWDNSIDTIETFNYKVEDFISNRAEYDIRQYDLMTTASPMRIFSEKEANIFKAEMTTNVREIGVQHGWDDTTITYELYLLNEDAADPTDGVLLASGREYFRYAGYHRMKTGSSCIVPEGRKYSVVVTQISRNEPYVSIFYGFNEQSVKDREAQGMTGFTKFSKAVVNRGESYILNGGKWIDWADYIPALRSKIAEVNPKVKENWFAIDNFSIKAYADFIEHALIAEAAEIGSSDAAAAVGVSDENEAEAYALASLGLVHSEISNNETAESSSAVKDGYISADDYGKILQTLIDPNRATGLKVVVSTVEISAADIDQEGLNKILEAADGKVARYADITLLVVALDNGEYLGSLHKTDNPIELAMAIPEDLLTSGNTIYILRLHDGNVERLAAIVRDGRVYFESDLFSKFALAYELIKSEEEPEPTPYEDKPEVAPENDGEIVKAADAEDRSAETGNAKGISANTGDASDVTLWLMLMALAAGGVITAARDKKTEKK